MNLQKDYRQHLPYLMIVMVGVYFAYTFAMSTFHLPLMGDHCMKTSKSVEVAYNLVRYQDPFHQYVDFRATPDNPTGRLGSIFRYESPLSAWMLGGIYALFDGTKFNRRVEIARYFTLFHLIGGYLLISLLVLRRDLFALCVFTFVFIGSAFTVSYSTKPLAETTAIFYEALFIGLGVHLMRMDVGALKKSLAVGGLSFLLCAGGKINYFLMALPVFLAFPFFDTTLPGVKNKLKYYGVLIVGGTLAVLGMLLFTKINFYGAFVFMIKGNKEIIDNSLWATFVEGFDAFDDVVKRTRNDFGKTIFDWGKYSIYYLAVKLLFLVIFKRKDASLFDRFSVMTAFFVMGHALNYTVLRNLYIPHKYYVVPLYIVFSLAITILLADIRRLVLWDFSTTSPRLKRLGDFFLKRFPTPQPAQTIRNRLTGIDLTPYRVPFSLALIFGFFAIYTAYMKETLSTKGWQDTMMLAIKTFGSSALTMDIRDGLKLFLAKMPTIMTVSAAVSGLFLITTATLRFVPSLQRLSSQVDVYFQKGGVTIVNLSMIFALSFPATFGVLKNGKRFYTYADSHTKLIEWAESLSRIREDTRSGDLVLAWKVCVAFYADKRSILDATPKDLAYYRKHNLASVMGPKRPLNIYYRRIEKYEPPMSYWVPKTVRSNKRR